MYYINIAIFYLEEFALELIQNIDSSLLEFIQRAMRTGILDVVMPFITRLGSGGAIWVAFGIFFVCKKEYRVLGFSILGALVLSFVVGNLILKPVIARPRPSDVNLEMILLISRPSGYSFPSGHTMSSFAVATAMWLHNRRLGVLALILAALISFSRLYLYVHYPTDILVGIIIGVSLGFIATKICKKIWRNIH